MGLVLPSLPTLSSSRALTKSEGCDIVPVVVEAELGKMAAYRRG